MSSASEASASIYGDSPASSVFTDDNESQGSNTIITRSKSRRNASDLAQSECARRQSTTPAVPEPDIKIRVGVMFEDMTVISAHRHVLLIAGNNFLEYCSTTDNNNSRTSKISATSQVHVVYVALRLLYAFYNSTHSGPPLSFKQEHGPEVNPASLSCFGSADGLILLVNTYMLARETSSLQLQCCILHVLRGSTRMIDVQSIPLPHMIHILQELDKQPELRECLQAILAQLVRMADTLYRCAEFRNALAQSETLTSGLWQAFGEQPIQFSLIN